MKHYGNPLPLPSIESGVYDPSATKSLRDITAFRPKTPTFVWAVLAVLLLGATGMAQAQGTKADGSGIG